MTKRLWEAGKGIPAKDLEELMELLSKPVPAKELRFRMGRRNKAKTKAMMFTYVDARYVQELLDTICGPYWKAEFKNYDSGNGLLCTLSIKIDGEWIGREDGAGTGRGELGDEIGIAEKGAISDALKRAAVNWGIARDLYSWPKIWVGISGYDVISGGPKFPTGVYTKEEMQKVTERFYEDHPKAKKGGGSFSKGKSRPRSAPKKAETSDKNVDKTVLKRAGEYVVPSGLPSEGTKVSDLEIPFLKYFAGVGKGGGGATFSPKEEPQTTLQAAAKYWLEHGVK